MVFCVGYWQIKTQVEVEVSLAVAASRCQKTTSRSSLLPYPSQPITLASRQPTLDSTRLLISTSIYLVETPSLVGDRQITTKAKVDLSLVVAILRASNDSESSCCVQHPPPFSTR